MEELAAVDSLIVRQKKEWTEILTGFETKNKYAVMDPAGNELYFAAEVGTGFLSRNFLQSLRPWTIQVLDRGGGVVLEVKRSFRFYFHRADVLDGQGNLLGSVRKRFSMLRRIYTVYDAGQEVFELFGPIFHPWTFRIRRDGQEIGKITKRWSGVLKEAFTDADNFGVAFPPEADPARKALLLGAVFLIDFVHFEKKGNG